MNGLTYIGNSKINLASLDTKNFLQKIEPPQNIYTLTVDGRGKFSFHAQNMDEANSKAKVWCRYHSWNMERENVGVREATSEEIANSSWFLHDDYID